MVRGFERVWYLLVGLSLASMAAFPIGGNDTTWQMARALCALGVCGAVLSIATRRFTLIRLSMCAFPFLARACLFAADPSVVAGHREVTGAAINLTLGAAIVLLQIAWDCEDWLRDE